MTVLLTNDDGIDSTGLEALQAALSVDHDVWTIAPDGERSAMSHYITLRDPIRCRKIAEQVYSSSGSPADCVIVGTLGGLPVTPDVVVSGINIGPNFGTDIIYSGTVAAARQAAFMGIPGIAVSINAHSAPFYLDPIANFVTEHLEDFRQLWNPRHLININAPNLELTDPPVRVTFPSWRIYEDRVERFDSPRGDTYYFLNGRPLEGPLEEGSDWHAVSEGAVSVSPIYLNPVDHHENEAYRDALFLKSGV
ncbi:MAG: 5'/3'-nucleotidase SurE [Spirochaetia bacterium]